MVAVEPRAPRSSGRRAQHAEVVARILLAASATLAAGGILVITLFVAASGWPLLQKTGWWAFVSGRVWSPGAGVFGVLPMIAGSVLVTLGALVFGCGLGLPAAIYLAEFAPRRLAGTVRQGVQLLAGIPSVVYGFYALTVLVPLIRRVSSGPGYSVLAGGIVLGVMVLPTVVSLSEDAIAGVPAESRLGALALGATRWQTMIRVLLPAARSGLVAAIILAAGRAVGETMAVIMVTGNVARFPTSLFDPVRTLTGNIALEMAYAAGDHQEALFATGLVLLLFAMSLNLLARAAGRRKRSG